MEVIRRRRPSSSGGGRRGFEASSSLSSQARRPHSSSGGGIATHATLELLPPEPPVTVVRPGARPAARRTATTPRRSAAAASAASSSPREVTSAATTAAGVVCSDENERVGRDARQKELRERDAIMQRLDRREELIRSLQAAEPSPTPSPSPSSTRPPSSSRHRQEATATARGCEVSSPRRRRRQQKDVPRVSAAARSPPREQQQHPRRRKAAEGAEKKTTENPFLSRPSEELSFDYDGDGGEDLAGSSLDEAAQTEWLRERLRRASTPAGIERERDRVSELREYLNGVRNAKDDDGALLVAFPDNFDEVVGMMGRREILFDEEEAAPVGDCLKTERGRRRKKAGGEKEKGAVDAVPWTKYLLDEALERQGPYGGTLTDSGVSEQVRDEVVMKRGLAHIRMLDRKLARRTKRAADLASRLQLEIDRLGGDGIEGGDGEDDARSVADSDLWRSSSSRQTTGARGTPRSTGGNGSSTARTSASTSTPRTARSNVSTTPRGTFLTDRHGRGSSSGKRRKSPPSRGGNGKSSSSRRSKQQRSARGGGSRGHTSASYSSAADHCSVIEPPDEIRGRAEVMYVEHSDDDDDDEPFSPSGGSKHRRRKQSQQQQQQDRDFMALNRANAERGRYHGLTPDEEAHVERILSGIDHSSGDVEGEEGDGGGAMWADMAAFGGTAQSARLREIDQQLSQLNSRAGAIAIDSELEALAMRAEAVRAEAQAATSRAKRVADGEGDSMTSSPAAKADGGKRGSKQRLPLDGGFLGERRLKKNDREQQRALDRQIENLHRAPVVIVEDGAAEPYADGVEDASGQPLPPPVTRAQVRALTDRALVDIRPEDVADRERIQRLLGDIEKSGTSFSRVVARPPSADAGAEAAGSAIATTPRQRPPAVGSENATGGLNRATTEGEQPSSKHGGGARRKKRRKKQQKASLPEALSQLFSAPLIGDGGGGEAVARPSPPRGASTGRKGGKRGANLTRQEIADEVTAIQQKYAQRAAKCGGERRRHNNK